MLRIDRNVSSVNRPLEQAPKILKPVRVTSARDVGGRVVDHFVNVVLSQRVVAGVRVGVNHRALFDVVGDLSGERRALAIGDDGGADLAATLFRTPIENAVNDVLASHATRHDLPLAAAGVHVGRLATDIAFVAFDLPSELVERFPLHGQSDPVEHEPSGLLRDAKGAGKFATADTVLGIGDAPDRHKPLVQTQRRVFKNGSYLRAELFTAFLVPALEHAAAGDDADVFPAALRALDASVGPLETSHVRMANIKISVADDGFRQSLWVLIVHARILGRRA